MTDIIITPGKVTRKLFLVFVMLLLLNLISNYLKWIKGYNTAFGFVPVFDFDNEYNLPSLFSFLLLLFSSFLLRYISFHVKRKGNSSAIYWKILSLIFLYLSIDEMTSLHESLSKVMIFFFGYFEHLNESRIWVVPYSIILVILAFVFLKFLAGLPIFYRIRFIIVGFIYVSGAIGVEILGDQYMFNHVADFRYGLLATLEESLEMIGIILFIRYLILYIAEFSMWKEIEFRFIFSKENI